MKYHNIRSINNDDLSKHIKYCFELIKIVPEDSKEYGIMIVYTALLMEIKAQCNLLSQDKEYDL